VERAVVRSRHRFRWRNDLSRAMRPELLDDPPTLPALFFHDHAGPPGPSSGSRQVFRDLEVVKPAESPLEGSERGRRREGFRGGQGRREVGEVTPVPHADAKAVEPPGRGLPPGPPVRLLDLPPSLIADLREVPVQALDAAAGRGLVEARPDPLEQTRVALGAQEDPKQLATDPSVVDESPPDLEETDAFARRTRDRPVRQESERNVPVPDAAHEPRQSLQASVIPPEDGARRLGE
jgi:hypothetical protein